MCTCAPCEIDVDLKPIIIRTVSAQLQPLDLGLLALIQRLLKSATDLGTCKDNY